MCEYSETSKHGPFGSCPELSLLGILHIRELSYFQSFSIHFCCISVLHGASVKWLMKAFFSFFLLKLEESLTTQQMRAIENLK